MPDLKNCDGTVVYFSPNDAYVLDWMSEDLIHDSQFETSAPEHHAADLVADCFPAEPVGAEGRLKVFKAVNRMTGEVAGAIAVDPEGCIHYMSVLPQYQNKFVPSMLLEETESYARKKGIRSLYADVASTVKEYFRKRNFLVHKFQPCRDGDSPAGCLMFKTIY